MPLDQISLTGDAYLVLEVIIVIKGKKKIPTTPNSGEGHSMVGNVLCSSATGIHDESANNHRR